MRFRRTKPAPYNFMETVGWYEFMCQVRLHESTDRRSRLADDARRNEQMMETQ